MSDEKPLVNGESATADDESPGGVLGIRITSRMGTVPTEVNPGSPEKPVVSRGTAPLGRIVEGGGEGNLGGGEGVAGGSDAGSGGRHGESGGRHGVGAGSDAGGGGRDDEGGGWHGDRAAIHGEKAASRGVQTATVDAKPATNDVGAVTREMKVVAHDAKGATNDVEAATNAPKIGSDDVRAATDAGGAAAPGVEGGARDPGIVTQEMKVVAHDTEPSGRVTKPLFRPQSAPPSPAKPWSGVTTEPLPMPADRLAGVAPSPDSSGSLAVDGGPKKLAEIKRSPAVESMLDGFGYARPDVAVQRAETDGDLYAAHASGPRAVPAAVLTPTLEPALLLSQSLVEAIKNPTPSPPLVALSDAPPRSPRSETKTVILPRTSSRRLAIAFVPCAVVVVAIVWIFARATAGPSHGGGVASPAGAVSSANVSSAPAATATATHVPIDLPPVPPSESVTVAATTAAPAAVAPLPTPEPPSPRAEHSAVAHPGPSPKHPAPAASSKSDTSSLHNDFEVQN